jgi:hypothetical protein
METVFSLQRKGAGETLLHETRQIFSLVTQENIRLTVAHVPGVQNDLTDALSRMDASGDYELKTEIYEKAIQKLSMKLKKCQKFLALPGQEARGSWGQDALLYSWSGEVQKLKQEKLTAVVVLPEWYSKAWWNLAAPNIVRSVQLGPASDMLKAGPGMPQDAKLPPGKLFMAVVSFS